MSQHLHANISDIPLSLDGDIYKLETRSTNPDSTTVLKGIPSQDYSLYLFNTVKFHLLPIFYLIDEESFTSGMQKFYHDPESMISDARLWLMQFLLVLAFGRSFLPHNKANDKNDPPGGTFFVRAINLLPNYSDLWKDPLLAIEIFGLAALYLYAVDRKESAYLYVS